MKDIYPELIVAMNEVSKDPKPLSRAAKIGIGWGTTCSEASNMKVSNFLAADGIENVIRVLEEIEDGRIPNDLEFVELNGCSAGCVGGVLNIENPYIAGAKIKKLEENAPSSSDSVNLFRHTCQIDADWTKPVQYEPVFLLGEDMVDSMTKLNQVDEFLKTLPQLDCGSCGAPTCRTLAEDIVKGVSGAKRENCIYLLRGFYSQMHTEDKK